MKPFWMLKNLVVFAQGELGLSQKRRERREGRRADTRDWKDCPVMQRLDARCGSLQRGEKGSVRQADGLSSMERGAF